MTQQFHEGQEVEVWGANMYPWRKAKIVGSTGQSHTEWMVEFPDGTRAVFDEEHIRADTTLRVSSNDPMGTRPMTKDEARDYKADLAQAHDEALQAEGKP